MRKFSRIIHKKIFIYLGVVTFIWLLSGVIMSLSHERDWVELSTKISQKNDDYNLITLSPSDVVRSLENTPNIEKIINIQIGLISGSLMYIAHDAKHNKHMVNALTGAYYSFSLADAIKAVPIAYSLKGALVDSAVINKHNLDYMWGNLPVFRLQFEDSSNIYYVDPLNAKALKTSFFTKVRSLAGLLHTFVPISKITGSEGLRQVSMIVMGIIALVGTVLGIYLTIPIRNKKKT